MSKNEEGNFQGKPRRRDGVNLLGKTGRQLTEARFNVFTKILKQKGLGRMMRPFAVFAADRLLLAAAGFVEDILRHVVRVAGIGVDIGVEHAAGGQVQGQPALAGLLRLGAGVDMWI